MPTTLEQYKKDLEALVGRGSMLLNAMQYECRKDEFLKALDDAFQKDGAPDKEKIKKFVKTIPSVKVVYQSWYSEAHSLIRQLMPNRLADFERLYQKPKTRKIIEYGNYVMEDYLQNLVVTTSWGDRKVGPEAAINQFEQQLAILRSVERRFESTLMDIRQLVQADLFDSELDAARELARNKFYRAAGAMVGVVLEKHLALVCENHSIKVTKKNPSISDLNNALKEADVLKTPDWRFVQHLGDVRNLCDHDKKTEPTEEQIKDLIAGVEKVTKTYS